jgi:CheY-like chemotaxis protein/anti-sigma regulatory factor (Ser/Thr protein kinase)
LVVDDDASLLDDYKRILTPTAETRGGGLFAQFESDLIGAAVGHKRFPEIDVVAVTQGHDAVDAVRAALDEDRPFAVAFIDLHLARGLDGLRTAEQIRALDPDIHIVLVSAKAEVHPVEMSERVAPADQLFFVSKPFHAAEIQQLALALAARWRGERWQFGGGQFRAGGLVPGRGGLPEVLERLPAGALVFDRRDRLLAANDAMGELFPELAALFVAGTSYEEIQRGAAERLLPENTLMRVDAWLAERMEWHLRSGGAVEQRLRGARWVLLVEEASASGETFCLYYDITDLKRREASRATSAHMTQMAQSFAALCEQLDGLAGASGGASGGAGEAGAESALGSRRGGGEAVAVLPGAIGGSSGPGHVQSLAGRLQAVAQRQKLAPERLGMNRIVGEVVRKLRGELDAEVQMEVIAGAGLWPILIDGAKFEIALAELVRNACDAMEGGGRLTVETVNIRLTREFVATRAGLAAGEYVRISVQDTGSGMAPELVERALNPFFTSKDKNAHMGLGLSVVYGFTHQSGGYIEVDGGEGRGATIDLYFPRGEELSAAPTEDETRDRTEAARAARAADKRRA